MNSTKLQDSDIWLLLSIKYCNSAATKEKIFEAGDFINHAIFTDEEYNGGIKRLVENDLIQEGNNKYSVTNKFKSFWNNGISKKRDVHGQLESLEKILLRLKGSKPFTE